MTPWALGVRLASGRQSRAERRRRKAKEHLSQFHLELGGSRLDAPQPLRPNFPGSRRGGTRHNFGAVT
jgi:hypothetical protein